MLLTLLVTKPIPILKILNALINKHALSQKRNRQPSHDCRPLSDPLPLSRLLTHHIIESVLKSLDRLVDVGELVDAEKSDAESVQSLGLVDPGGDYGRELQNGLVCTFMKVQLVVKWGHSLTSMAHQQQSASQSHGTS